MLIYFIIWMGGYIHLLLAFVLLLATALTVPTQEEQQTRLVYFVEHQDEQEEDFIEITLEIEAQSRSLVDAISAARKVAGEVKELAGSYCKEHTKKGKGDCKQAVEVSQFQIEPQYQIIRKESAFSTFVVSHQVSVKVFNPDNIGYLVDSFLKYSELTLKQFSWRPLNQIEAQQAAVKQGVQQGEQLCEQVGLSLTRIVDVQEIDQAVAQEQEQGEEDGEEAPEITIYRFQVECGKPKKK